MKHEIRHELGVETAMKVARAAFDAYEKRYVKYSPRATWNGEHADLSFDVKGMTLRGSIDVKANSIELDLDVPFLFRPFKGKAIEVIDREVRDWLARAKAGEI